jgi:hypothetical protein
MLPYALAIVVGLSSLVLFSTAFFMSDVHRQDDFLWSGIGLFYALVLWFCATRITGGVLLGQAAAVALLVSYNWQTLKLRKAIANPERAAEFDNFSVVKAVSNIFNRQSKAPIKSATSQPKAAIPKVNKTNIATPELATNLEGIVIPPVTENPSNQDNSQVAIEPETKTIISPVASQTATQKPQPEKKRLFGKFLNLGKDKPAAITNTKLDEILDDEELLEDDFEENTARSNKKTSIEETIAQISAPTSEELEVAIESISIPETPQTLASAANSSDEEVIEVTIEKIEVKLPPEVLAEEDNIEAKIDEILSITETTIERHLPITEKPTDPTAESSSLEETVDVIITDELKAKQEPKKDSNADLTQKIADNSEIDEFLAKLDPKQDLDKQ